MSNLTPGQHKQLLNAILEYLQELELRAPAGLIHDQLQLTSAIQHLAAATGLIAPNAAPYAIHPHTLPSVFSAAGIPAPAVSTAQVSPDFEAKFTKYLSVLKERGYFKDAVEGSPEYQLLVEKARAKLLERTEGANIPTGSAPTATPQTAKSSTEISEMDRARAEEMKKEGNTLMTSKDYERALERYTRAIELDPNNAVYYANRAAAHSHLGNHEAAVVDSKKAIAIDPQYVKAYSRLGLAYFVLGKYKEAIEEGYKKALELEPNNQLMKDSLAAAQEKLSLQGADSSSSTSSTNTNTNEAPNIASMLGNLMGGGNGGGVPDLGAMFSNPQFMQMASQMAQSPQFQQMAQQLTSNPDLLSNLGSMFRGSGGSGQQ